MMKFASFVLQLCSWLVLVSGILGTFAALTAPAYSAFGNSWLGLALGTVIAWALLYGIGAAFAFVEDIAIDARLAREANERTAKSMEALANRQRKPAQSQVRTTAGFDFPE